jgi:hypothetical protein
MDEEEGIMFAILFHKMTLKGCCILYNAKVPINGPGNRRAFM